MSDGRRYRCPECHQSDTLWEGVEVPGWRTVDMYLTPTKSTSYPEADVEWHQGVTSSGDYGCTCGWEGYRDSLEALGIDDKPLPFIHKGQLEIAS